MLNLKKTALAAAVVCALLSCNKNGEPNYKTNDNGLRYYFYEDKEGPNVKVGDFITLHFSYKTATDSVLRNTWKEGDPIPVIVQEPSFKGGIEEGLTMLSEGDSVSFQLNADSLFKKTFMARRPDFIDSASYLTFTIKLVKIQTKEQFQEEQAKKMEERRKQMEQMMDVQKAVDDSLIRTYLTQNSIVAKRTESGIYYSLIKEGKGKKATSGSTVRVHYTGKLINGKVFDSSVGKEPLEFLVGVGQVIPGWDEGLQLLKEGSKATLFIPSGLGYGPMDMGDQIPANSVLIFEVDLLKVSDKK